MDKVVKKETEVLFWKNESEIPIPDWMEKASKEFGFSLMGFVGRDMYLIEGSKMTLVAEGDAVVIEGTNVEVIPQKFIKEKLKFVEEESNNSPEELLGELT